MELFDGILSEFRKYLWPVPVAHITQAHTCSNADWSTCLFYHACVEVTESLTDSLTLSLSILLSRLLQITD